ncbi:MAG: hypothetical protein DIZ80_15355 [endosymbiont of Galathealinum brachiosum]|uniref:Lipoprotein SmpA/OmlA domain-containing protein n=1 Tax=endosymbiont of Galathealinum brachiosum TaxID=2200906 RepID=A0A370DAY1_9GAMM|nr:MAG: hypothetical protein DIZ80_15355 [endosymbiont of Galathealinum brachiosum]
MKNLTLKTAGLLILALFSTQGLAGSPWADDTAADDTTATEQTTTEVMPQETGGSPAMTEETTKPVETVEVSPQPEVINETVQQGDVLNVNEAPQAVGVRLLDFPRRGMTTDKVENELGRPSEIIPSIGQPPISRWVYDDRTVYFEYSSVIHVVAK